MVGLDDTPSFPDLNDVGIVDFPFVLLVGFEDDVHSLDVRRQTCRIHSLSQVLDKGLFLLVILELELFGKERAVEDFLYVLTVPSEGGSYSKEVCCRESWCGNVQIHGFSVGPYSRSLGSIYVLNNFVLDIAEDMMSSFIFRLADFCSDLD